MRAAKNILSQKALTTFYYSLVHSHLIYAIHIWSSTLCNILNELVLKQKMAIRIIHNSSYNAHTESLFTSSAILLLPLLANFFKLLFMHQHKFNNLAVSFGDTWITNAERRGDNEDLPTLHNQEDYYVPFTRLQSTDIHPII
jgi:hypothetical protein